jgi:DNA-binding SARP family transcriptional activator
LRLWRDDVELDPGPRQQAYLLAVLLARQGEVVSTSELLDLLWDDDPPVSGRNVIHKYIGALRRLLEPDLPARSAGSYLQRRGNGYLFVARPGMLDLVTFRDLVQAAEGALTQCGELALDSYARAMGLWHGRAGNGLVHGTAAMPIFSELDREFFDACVVAAGLAISLDQPQLVLLPLHLAAKMAPLHEPVQASLISTLGAAGQQAKALSVYRAVRSRLADDLGIDPSPALQAAHQRVLNQTAAVAAGQAVAEPPDGRPSAQRPAALRSSTAASGVIVGRTDELTVLRRAVEGVLTGGRGLVLVEGEPGVGKSRLLEEIAVEADQRGVFMVWGRCLEGEGTPSMWPWVQVVGAVLRALPAAARGKWLADEIGRLVEPRDDVITGSVIPDNGAQFRLFERVVAIVGEVATLRPLVFVIDDLQWADVASLHLFSHLAARLPDGIVIIGALRDRAPSPGSELARMLAAASRVPGHRRIRLGPLGLAEVAELVRGEIGQDPDPGAVRNIHARTAGNPFFVRELSRLLADGDALTEDATARTGVPSTVRDVVRDRIADLDDDTRSLLQIAALIGRDVDVGLLVRVADLDSETCVDRLEPLEALGLLEPTPGDPYTIRFPHDLVRESVAASTSQRQATRLHLKVADALEHIDAEGEFVAERLAHHLWAAGPLADPARTAVALTHAGRHAAGKSALEAADWHLRTAVQVARTAGLAELELAALSQLTVVVGMRSMWQWAVDLLERAEHLSRNLGRQLEATGFLFARWAMHNQAMELDRGGPLAHRLLEQGKASSDPTVRAYGIHAWGIHQWATGNIGEAFRYLSQAGWTFLADHTPREEKPLRYDLELLMTGMVAETSAHYGDVDGAQTLLDAIEIAAGDDAYAITVWASTTTRTTSIVGDAAQALRAAERGIAVDPDFTFGLLGTYQRLARCWALAMTGSDPAGAAVEAQRLIETNLLNPPRSCISTWYGLLCEMHLAAAALDEAAAALDRADVCLDTYGQRNSEGLILLLRAQLLQARGEPLAVVRNAAEKARKLSTERGAHLFAHRAEKFLAELEEPSGQRRHRF